MYLVELPLSVCVELDEDDYEDFDLDEFHARRLLVIDIETGQTTQTVRLPWYEGRQVSQVLVDGNEIYLSDYLNNAVHVLRFAGNVACLLYTSPSPRDRTRSRMPSSA